MLRSLVLALPVLAALPSLADAKCARTEQRPVVLTTRDTQLPSDGGVLVGWANAVYDPNDTPTGAGDPSDQPGWVALDGKAKVALTRTALAPGLSVYTPAAGAHGFVLQDAKARPLGTFTHDGKASATMAAPIVVKLALSDEHRMRWPERHAVAKLRTPPPASAVALITYADVGGKRTPIGFVRLPDSHDKLDELETFADAGHCGSLVAGARPPAAGEKVAFAWVDAFGHVSPVGSPVTAK